NVPEGEATRASLFYRAADGTLAAFECRDALRGDAADTVHTLAGMGLAVALLSGDREEAVRKAAEGAGIGAWRAEADPAEKIAALDALGRDHRILMVGDGLNDAPALARAHVSISPANAADITQRAADLVFQGDRLKPVAEAVRIARRARSMAFQNFAIALTYNAICVPLAMAGLVTPLIAAVAMSTSSICVTANALRLGAGRARA
ncbi:MAG: HAD family hydrolase, partial [Alphaproteobacteria bacterium]